MSHQQDGGVGLAAAAAPLVASSLDQRVLEAFKPTQGFELGVEVEFFTAAAGGERPAYDLMADLAQQPLPNGSSLSVEPGSQIEISTRPHASISDLLISLDGDIASLERRLDLAAVEHWVGGIDLSRPPQRTCLGARYATMEAHFDRHGPAGRWMMTNTCALQINVCHGDGAVGRRWKLFNQLAPLLTAAFANSGGVSARGVPWRSLRQGCWSSMDPLRCGFAPTPSRSAFDDYRDYALHAPVMMVWDGDVAAPSPPGLTFASWMAGAGPRCPTESDFDYHLTTLFPPIRAKGWIEIRCIDMVPRDVLEIAVNVVAAACDEAVMEELERSLPSSPTIAEAARVGFDSPRCQRATERFFTIVADHAEAECAPGADGIAAYLTDYVAVGRHLAGATTPISRARNSEPRYSPELVDLGHHQRRTTCES